MNNKPDTDTTPPPIMEPKPFYHIPDEMKERLSETVGAWLRHIDRQKEKAETLQRAAILSRQGNRKEAMRLKGQVDRMPRVYDAGTLEPVMRELLTIIDSTEESDGSI